MSTIEVTVEPVEPKEIDIQNIEVKIKPIETNMPGFLPLYRKLLSLKRAFGDFQKAQPEDIDEACKLLSQHITSPSDQISKTKILESMSSDDLMRMFDAVMGKNTVPPAKDAV